MLKRSRVDGHETELKTLRASTSTADDALAGGAHVMDGWATPARAAFSIHTVRFTHVPGSWVESVEVYGSGRERVAVEDENFNRINTPIPHTHHTCKKNQPAVVDVRA